MIHIGICAWKKKRLRTLFEIYYMQSLQNLANKSQYKGLKNSSRPLFGASKLESASEVSEIYSSSGTSKI